MSVTPKVVMTREVYNMMTTNELRIMTSTKYLALHWMHQGQEMQIPSICLTNKWRIKYEDVKRTLDVTTEHNVRMQILNLARNDRTNDRMIRYKRIHE